MPNIEEQSVAKLSNEEKHAYLEYKNSGEPRLSLVNSLRAFELFLNGSTCEEIVKLNEGFTLGAVIDARIRDQWDQKRESELNSLYKGVGERIKQTHSESMVFVSNLLAVAHRRFGPKIQAYLQSGMEEDLEGVIKIDSIKGYKELAELFLKVSGILNIKKVEGEIVHKVDGLKDPAKTAQEVFYSISDRPLTEPERDKALEVLEKMSLKNKK